MTRHRPSLLLSELDSFGASEVVNYEGLSEGCLPGKRCFLVMVWLKKVDDFRVPLVAGRVEPEIERLLR